MKYVLFPEQMQALDKRTIEELGIPSRVLMETAGKSCAEILIEDYENMMGSSVMVLCGTGNNGGDGAVIARWLQYYGYEALIFVIGSGKRSPDMSANLTLCEKLGIRIETIPTLEDIPRLELVLKSGTFLIDAIFGTGFKGAPDEFYTELFKCVNQSFTYRVAIDIPSGMDGGGKRTTAAIMAMATLAIDALKPAHLLVDSTALCGKTRVVPIGIPEKYYLELDPAQLIDKDTCEFPRRSRISFKNSYGNVLIVAGSSGMSGAALMASKAALRTGAGYVHLLTNLLLEGCLDGHVPEILINTIDLDEDYNVDLEDFDEKYGKPSVVLIGPGMGQDSDCAQILDFLINKKDTPLVIDADALNILADRPDLLRRLKGRKAILTPHLGEFVRLSGSTKEEILEDPLGELRKYVAKHQVAVLLKAHYTIYCDSVRLYFVNSGNDGLATGGSGDVLAGVVASFIAQRMPIHKAAVNASFLLGFTAEQLAKKKHTAAITPTEVIEHLFDLNDEVDFKERVCLD